VAAFVVDASVVVKWVVAEVSSEQATRLLTRELIAPALIEAECANVLWTKARRGEITPVEARQRTEFLLRAPLRLVPISDLVAPALSLAFELDQPVYDCLYLALALRESATLITADRRFVEAAATRRELKGSVLRLSEIEDDR